MISSYFVNEFCAFNYDLSRYFHHNHAATDDDSDGNVVSLSLKRCRSVMNSHLQV